MLELLRPKDDRAGAPAEGTSSAPEGLLEERRVFVCTRCETEITDSRSLFSMRSNQVEQVFPNPYGSMRVIVTARDARSVRAVGTPTAEFTWFEGYTWQVAICESCSSHLGWLFEADAASAGARVPHEPRAFFGFLKTALTER